MPAPNPRKRPRTIDYLARRVLSGDREVDDAISELVGDGVLGPRDVGERLTELEGGLGKRVPVAVEVRCR